MPLIYFDNFRGFDKTFLPLKNVNFFVGENSSGKTSVMKLIKNLSDPSFWVGNEFQSDQADLGYYSEIASCTQPEKKTFEVGLLTDNVDKSEAIQAIIVKYENDNGLASMKEVCMLTGGINLQVVKEGTSLKYRKANLPKSAISQGGMEFFKKWVFDNGLKSRVYKKANIDSNIFDQLPFFLQIQSILLYEKRSEKSKISGSFRVPAWMRDITWLAPIRTEPKRTYDNYKFTFNPDGTHAPYLLKRLFGKESNNKDQTAVQQILQKFGKDSGLFDKIIIKPLEKSETAPFEMHIQLDGHDLKITNVGYGVSQILPVVIEILARPQGSWFAIQQPEIHLHPKGQAAFGDFIFKSVENDHKNFIIETHSDYTIDRFRLRLNHFNKNPKKKTAKTIESQIIFFKHGKGGNDLCCIPIHENGTLPEDQPSEFRDFFIKEQLDLLQI